MTFFIIFVFLRSGFTSPSCTVLQVLALISTSGSDGSLNYTRNWLNLEKLFCRDTLNTSLKSSSHYPSSTPSYLLRLSTSWLRGSLSFLKMIHQSRSQLRQRSFLPHQSHTSLDQGLLSYSRPLEFLASAFIKLEGPTRIRCGERSSPEPPTIEWFLRKCLGLATTFNWTITEDETSYQDLILVVEVNRGWDLIPRSDLGSWSKHRMGPHTKILSW